MKNQKIPRLNPKVKSQGQIPRSNPKSNTKLKIFNQNIFTDFNYIFKPILNLMLGL